MSLGGKLGALAANVGRFESLVNCSTLQERQRLLLRTCDEVFDAARDRVVVSKKGQEYDAPDFHAQIKCVELAARLTAVLKAAEKRIEDGEGDLENVELEKLLALLRSNGYDVKKAA